MNRVQIIKTGYYLNAYRKRFFFKLIYGKSLLIGKNVTFRKGFSLIIDNAKAKIIIGNNCFFNNNCSIAAHECIQIVDNTIFGENVKIYDHSHKYKDHKSTIKQQGFTSSKIYIGSDCWIASNVVILKGVTIGDRSIIGASCIVYKDIPPASVLINQQQQILRAINFGDG